MKNKPLFFLALLSLLFLGACNRVHEKIEPQFHFSVQDKYIQNLSSPFSPLSRQERLEAWGQEYLLGQKFTQNLDLYRAITSFKRSEFLVPVENTKRLEEIQYQILLAYYLGKRYEEVIREFIHSPLYTATKSFPAYCDLLIIIYESYLQLGDKEKGEYILQIIEHHYPEAARDLKLSTMMTEGDLSAMRIAALEGWPRVDLAVLLNQYNFQKKSPQKAQVLNAALPGAGYLYVGQKQSALTSFLLNGLFIWAAAHFYTHGHIAAGIITTSFEAGWYFGGIYGAGQSAKLYNERLYERHAYPILNQNHLFPVLMLHYGF